MSYKSIIRRKIPLFVAFAAAGAWPAAETQPTQVPSRLTLQEASRLLRLHNPRLQAGQLNLEMEQADVLGASRRPNPLFSVTSEGLSPQSDGLDAQEISLTVRLPIETAGKRAKRTRLEESDIPIAASELRGLRLRLEYRLKQAYYQLVRSQEELSLAREILERFQQVVRLNRIRFERGEISGGELRRSEAEQYRFFEDLVSAEVRVENAQDAVLALLGLTSFEQPVEAVDGFDAGFRPPPAVRLKQMALDNRPDLGAQRSRLERSRHRVALEKARSKPDITPFAGYRREFGADGAVIGVDFPLFVFNRNQGAITRAGIQRQRERRRLRILEVAALREVQAALNRLEGHRRRVEALRGKYLVKSRQARDIAESAYRLGAASLIEFMDAERTFRETSRLYNQALYDFQISRAGLELAVGEDLP